MTTIKMMITFIHVKPLINPDVHNYADFRTSIHFSIHPENNKIKNSIFSQSEIRGLLDQYGIVIE